MGILQEAIQKKIPETLRQASAIVKATEFVRHSSSIRDFKKRNEFLRDVIKLSTRASRGELHGILAMYGAEQEYELSGKWTKRLMLAVHKNTPQIFVRLAENDLAEIYYSPKPIGAEMIVKNRKKQTTIVFGNDSFRYKTVDRVLSNRHSRGLVGLVKIEPDQVRGFFKAIDATQPQPLMISSVRQLVNFAKISEQPVKSQ